ncbi:WhiB family transcriptional regulator [Corynebacterium aurimucosum]|uniref:WhiB family transcriptional regulator n=1 Tax=Corynebacterium aurimucosum TaxID=169292 RepID=UPI001C0F2432|nr:WhiB family transcriptional regulator [Corynebacterium aurimucosum]MBU5654319.1 WhiB family transcriptional regulator [Corynebacterium aurimucosum]
MTTATLTHNPTMLNMNHWWEKAQCAGQPLNNYVLTGQRDKQATARQLCQHCPVKPQCAYDALEHQDSGVVRAGVWIPEDTAAMRYERETVYNQLYDAVLGGV